MKYILIKLIILSNIIFLAGCGSSESPSTGTGDSTTTTPVASYPYEQDYGEYAVKSITLPTCDASNAKVQFIETLADWGTINSSTKSIFCVKPGYYQNSNGAAIQITASGTADNPRYIILDNGNDTHPASLSESALANVDIEFNNANYWVVDRMASIGTQNVYDAPLLFKNATNIVINREFIDGSSGGIIFRNGCHDNTVQNSRIQNMSETGLKADRVGIELAPRETANEITGTQILYNEIYNCNDGFQAVWRSGTTSNYAGTVVYGNDISVDSNIYTDCSGNFNVNGECSYSENGVDIKAGSDSADNPMIIKNNRLWGFRPSDTTNSNLADPGAALVVHYGVKNISIDDNIIFDTTRGIVIADKNVFDYALTSSQVTGNILSNTYSYPISLEDAVSIALSENVVINGSDRPWLTLNRCDYISVKDHKIVNSNDTLNSVSSTNIDASNNQYFATVDAAGIGSVAFTTNKFSTTPETINPLD